MNILGGCYSNTQRFCYSLGSVVFPPKTGAIIPCLVCGALYSTRSLAKGKLSSGEWDRNALAGVDGAGNREVQDSQA